MAQNISKINNFRVNDRYFINLYSEENPILTSGEKCYFLFSNIFDIHRPLIGYGLIREDYFTDSLNKTYYIELIQITESQTIIDKFLSKPVFLNQYKNQVITKSQKIHTLNKSLPDNFYKLNLFKIESFFIRKTFEQIVTLREEFVQVIKEDLYRQIDEIESI